MRASIKKAIKEFIKKGPIIPKQPSINRCMEYVSKWDDDDDDKWDDEDEEAALLALMIKYL